MKLGADLKALLESSIYKLTIGQWLDELHREYSNQVVYTTEDNKLGELRKSQGAMQVLIALKIRMDSVIQNGEESRKKLFNAK